MFDSIWSFTDLIYSADLKDQMIKGMSKKLLECPDAFEALRRAVDHAAANGEDACPRDKGNFILNHEGQRFRVAISDDAERSRYFYLRRIEPQIISLENQGYPKELIEKLLQRRHGLIVFSGSMGQGKTSAASSYVTEWLEHFGGHAETLEDPPEYLLHGWHGDGLCIQRQVDAVHLGGGIAETMRHCAPDIIYVGELRHPEAARQAIIASANGHAVVTTIHSGNIVDAVWRLISLSDGGESLVPVLANGLSLLIHQRIEQSGNIMTLKTWYVDFDAPDTETSLRSSLRSRKPEAVRDYIISRLTPSNYGTEILKKLRAC